ncbi:MAG: LysR family transcriptional regulator [Anaerolineae bacterium]|nr:LysR family transcriptional regulator [Anaerolineae bacterium]
MEPHQLRGFITVARLGSFTQAADELYLTQPALSLQIKALEKALGERLFERRGRQLLLTPAGNLLRQRAEQILGLIEQTRDEMAALKGLQGGRLSIGTNDSNCLYLLPDLIQEFRRQFPEVELHLTNSHSSQVAAWVIEGRVEFGLVTLPILEPQLEAQPLFEREDMLICHPDHPLGARSVVEPEELVAYPLLLLDTGSISRVSLNQFFTQADLLPKVVMELGSIEVIKRYVEINLGVSIIPRFTAEAEISTGRLHALHLDWLPPHAVGLIQRRKGYFSPAARMFLDMLKSYLPL